MTIGRRLIALALLAGIASTAQSQTAAAENPFAACVSFMGPPISADRLAGQSSSDVNSVSPFYSAQSLGAYGPSALAAADNALIPAPNIFARPITATTANPFSAPMPPMGPQLPSARKPVGSSAANGTAPFYPTQVAQAYGLDILQGGLGTSAIVNNGAGQTIAIIDAYHYANALSTLNTFCAGYNGNWTLPSMSASGQGPTFTQLNQNGGTTVTAGTNSGWNGEEALDFEYVHAMAPQANIILYEANSANDSDLYAAVQAAANNPAVSVVTMSWSGPESSGDLSNNSLFTTPGTKASQNVGVTFCASTGDKGDINHTPGNSNSGFPATSPNVVAVGGTTLTLSGTNGYSGETAWSWNAANNWGGGGGTSTIQAKPGWQSTYATAHPGNILTKTTKRAEPDVSMVADPNTGVYTYDSANGAWFQVGGTSLSSPLFAGLVADADEMRAAAGRATLSGTQTLAALYSLPSSDFHDITSGNIDSRGRTAYSATTGYDLATGIGSPIANLLVPDLANYGIIYSTSYSITTSTTAATIHVATAGSFTSTTLSGSIANTGSTGANSDALTYSAFGLTASGGTLSGGTLPLGAGTLAAASVNSGTATFSSDLAGSFTITPTAASVLNLSASGTPTLSASNSTTIAVYRLASAGMLTGLTFSGNYHLGDSVALQALTVSNTAANDGYSEGLNAGFGGNSSTLTVSGSTGLIGAGTSNSSSLQVGIDTGSVGAKSGTLSVALSSDGTGTSGLGKTALPAQPVTAAAGSVYRLAAANSLGAISFGSVHVGASASQTLMIANTAANDGWSEALDASFGSVPAGLISSGSVALLTSGGSSAAMSLAMDTSTAGTKGGNVTVNFISNGTGTSGLGTTALGSQTISATGNVYSGQGVWNANGGGSWTDFSKWTALGGVPGVDGPLSAADTALLGSALSSGSATVSLDGASPQLSSLTFDSTASYTIAQGSGGTLQLDAGTGTAAVAVAGGNHALTAPVTLVSTTTFSQTAGSSLTISGPIGESGGSLGLVQAGPGTLVLGGPSTYSGGTTISGGLLSAGGPNTLPPNSDVFVTGGTLDATAGAQVVKSLTISPSGALNLSTGSLLTCTSAATFGNGMLNISNYTPGTIAELISYGSHENSGSDAFFAFTVDGSASTGYQLLYKTSELDIAPLAVLNTSILVPSTSAVNFGRVLSTAIGTQAITVGLSSGTMTSTGATAAVLTGGSQGATITSGTASGAGYITGAPQTWTISVSLGGGLGPHSDTVAIQNTGDSGSGPSGTAGPPATGNQQAPINVAVSGSVVSQRTVNSPATTVLPGTWQGSYHAGDSINVPVAFGYSYPGGGSGSLIDTESASVAAYGGPADDNGITLAGGPDSITSSAGFTRTLTGIAAVSSSGGSFALNVSPELSPTATVTAAYTISVTSGSMNWAGPSGGSWSSGGWTDATAGGAPVAPGLNPAWTHSDVANFGSDPQAGAPGSAVTVNLDVSSSLRAIGFTGTTSYTLSSGGGTLLLNNGGGGASITANASAQSVIDAPVALADNLTVTGSGLLTFGASSSISDNGGGSSLMLNASGGTLVLSGSDSYTGGTFVTAGELVVTSANSICDGTSLTVGDGGAFAAPIVGRVAMMHASAIPVVPEPGTLVLAAVAAALLAIHRMWRAKS